MLGRPDGIGNRIEEVLSFIESYPDANIFYVWNNAAALPTRSYPVLVGHPNVIFIEAPPVHNRWLRKLAKIFLRYPRNIINPRLKPGVKLKKEVAKLISPRINVKLTTDKTVIGLHVRGGDRIVAGTDKEGFMGSEKEFSKLIDRAVEHIISLNYGAVLVCAHDETLRVEVERNLIKSGKEIVKIKNEQASKDFLEFFALAKCNEIVIASKFSTFSLMASLIGGVPVTHFGIAKDLLSRYELKNISFKN